MIDNPRSPRVRAVAKLAKRAAREETGLFLVEGPQALREALAFHPELLVDVFAVPGVFERHPELGRGLSRAGIEAETVSQSVIDAMADTVTPQGVVAVARQFPVTIKDMLAGSPRLVAILHEVRDPGNAGTILRAADAAGADGVIFTGKSVDAFNSKVVRSTTGSIFHVPLAQGGTLEHAVQLVAAAGLQVFAADIGGDELPTLGDRIAEPTAWLFGNEAHGLADEERSLADRSVRVPIYGHAESMNLATAASVCLYQSAFAHRA